ncbi:hypothetical protein L1987_63556 [Smallanthus sonchifolius]|uniref:Uncharacterized protein n=1 Tax=Smallanthus sonchifolius TaxID=185202 RepID=A0ACB9CDL0_9ASTR|nr:hypothetical protein L1987_63556 [Smallanthus sonchifolius]
MFEMPSAIANINNGKCLGQFTPVRPPINRIVTLLKNQHSAFHDLQRTVEYIAKSFKDRQGGPSSSSNALVMAVSVGSVEKKEVFEDDFHSSKYNIPLPEEVKKIDWRARFTEIDAKMVEEQMDEEVAVEVPAEKAEEGKTGVEMETPEIDLARVPYPTRLLPFKQAREHNHFLDIFKLLKVNLPLIEALQIMPKYGKVLKDLLSNMKKLEEFALAPPLVDLGASINLIPYSLYKQLDLGEPQPTCMSIALADRSVKYPRGIMENILVKVGKFVFLVDFVFLDMEVDNGVPFILRCPFLRTAKAVIGIFDWKLTLRVGDESVIFDSTQSVDDVGEHSHSMCMLDAFMDYHQDSDREIEVSEPAHNFKESSDWAVKLERLLEEPDEYGDEVPEDMLEIMEELDEIIGKPPSVGMTKESVKDPDDPCEGLEVPHIGDSSPEPLSITIVHSERVSVKPNPSSSPPRSRPSRKRTHMFIESSDFKLWWKDLCEKCDMSSMFVRSRSLLNLWRTGRPQSMKAVPVRIKENPPDRLGFTLDLAWEIIGNEVPGDESLLGLNEQESGKKRAREPGMRNEKSWEKIQESFARLIARRYARDLSKGLRGLPRALFECIVDVETESSGLEVKSSGLLFLVTGSILGNEVGGTDVVTREKKGTRPWRRGGSEVGNGLEKIDLQNNVIFDSNK